MDEGTSIVALSVSSSSTAWSFASASPGLTSTRRTSPVVMFSPSSGRVNSVTACTQIVEVHPPQWTQRTQRFNPECYSTDPLCPSCDLWWMAVANNLYLDFMNSRDFPSPD